MKITIIIHLFIFFLDVTDKPLPQGGLRGILGILGAVIAALSIIGGAVTVFIIYRRQKKNRSDTENDL
ncbi:hypothetical protein NXF25_014352 [Crotalus adamanteus]|uniref:MHC class II antigen n=1 Tax=Crotalus adamanteus TaxID=8729 RepID=A0AAW1AZN5_CROAD